MIPKILHYIWLGGNEKPEIFKESLESWKKYCPDYEIIEWNESNMDLKLTPLVEFMYKEKCYAHVSDYYRAYLLQQYGGFYIDIDVKLFKGIDFLRRYDAVYSLMTLNLLTNAFSGAIPNHSTLIEYMRIFDSYTPHIATKGLDRQVMISLCNCSNVLTIALEEKYGFDRHSLKRQRLEDNVLVLSPSNLPDISVTTDLSRIGKVDLSSPQCIGMHYSEHTWIDPLNETLLKVEETLSAVQTPKKLHFCWFGRGKKPDYYYTCRETWEKHLPDWEIIEWNEDNFDVNSTVFTKLMYEHKMYSAVSDYVRYYALYTQGGLYLDIDVLLVNSINNLLYLDAVFTWESQGVDYLGCAFLLSKPNDPVIRKCLDFLENVKDMGVVSASTLINEYLGPEALYDTLIPTIFSKDEKAQLSARYGLLSTNEFSVALQSVKDLLPNNPTIDEILMNTGNIPTYGIHLNAHNWGGTSNPDSLEINYIIENSELLKDIYDSTVDICYKVSNSNLTVRHNVNSEYRDGVAFYRTSLDISWDRVVTVCEEDTPSTSLKLEEVVKQRVNLEHDKSLDGKSTTKNIAILIHEGKYGILK